LQSQNVPFVAELMRHSGVLAEQPLLVVGDAESEVETAFADRGIEVESVSAAQLSELEPESYAFVLGDSPGGDGLEDLRRIAGTGVILTTAANGAGTGERLPEIERFFRSRGDSVTVIDDLVVALRAAPESSGATGAEERLALLRICLAQAALASAAGQRLDESTVEIEHLRARLAEAQAEAEDLSAKLARTLNALDGERREHAELSARVQGWRSSRAWPILVVSYNIVHAGRVLRSRWARRRSRRLGPGDG
jgi:hypothetical protein